MKKNFKKGFTIVELLLVVAIIAILAGSILTVVDPMGKKKSARDAVRKSDLAIITSSLESYFANNHKYPVAADLAALQAALSPASPATVYLKTIPVDPYFTVNANFKYCYKSTDDQNYVLCARLERGADEFNSIPEPKRCHTGTITGSSGIYCVTNPF